MNLPNFKFEQEAWSKGYKFVAGCDEVGRGSFAGPVVAGCVVFGKGLKIDNLKSRIDDSKKLAAKERENADIWIKKHALAWGVGEANVAEINKLGVGKAAGIAFRRSIRQVNSKLKSKNLKYIEFLLLDAFYLPNTKGIPKKRQLPLIKGDQKSFSIAAASIIAKVYRDKLMTNMGKKYGLKKYRWHQNKGYGTFSHRKVILKYGITKFHRKVFVETYLSKSKLVILDSTN